MRLYAPAILLFLWAMLAIAFASWEAFGAIAAVTLAGGVVLSAFESFRIYARRHGRRG